MKALLRSTVAAAAALAVASCADSPTQPDRPVTVTVAVSRSALRAGDSTTVSVTTTNTGNAMVSVSGPECPTQFEVLKNGMSLTPDASDMCPAVYGPSILGPGESRTARYVWYGDNPAWAVLLNAGTYTLRGRVWVNGRLMTGSQVPVQLLP